ncbi:hypothetical protein H5410_020988 [Solanum commersonii]|uniref:Uncharacterized protein n=1 Tax=Solanum commersonii TaxID=4109 RepID=A0A9J5Z9M7_SOLCO|nr:hypothetical protein H5410_020988 [Solanum commersonii]
MDSDYSGSPKKKFKFDFDSSLDKKVDFWSSSHEVLFHSLKDKTLVHGRVVDLDILSSLDCHIKNLFEFQGCANIFSVPMVAYDPLIRLFYANLRSPKVGELESLVLRKRIFIHYKKLILYLGFLTLGSWPLLRTGGLLIVMSRPKDLPFESQVIAHIIATTLLLGLGLTLRLLSVIPYLSTAWSLCESASLVLYHRGYDRCYL